jgi:hypothetical protein
MGRNPTFVGGVFPFGLAKEIGEASKMKAASA